MAWQRLQPSGQFPGSRAAHSCDQIGNKLYIFGGWNGMDAMKDLYIYDIVNNSWTQEVPSGEIPIYRNNHTTTVVGTQLFIHGGHNGQVWLDDMIILETEPKTIWMNPIIYGTKPSARACHSVNQINQKLYLFGGFDGEKCFNQLMIFQLELMKWESPETFGTLPSARNAHSMVSYGTKLILFGGHSGTTHLFDLFMFNTENSTWSSLISTGNPPKGLRGHTANISSNCMYIFGGYDGSKRSNDLHIYNLESNRWIPPALITDIQGNINPSPRQRHSACSSGKQNENIYVFGGFDGNKWLNDLYVLNVGIIEEKSIASENIKQMVTNIQTVLFNQADFSDCQFLIGEKVIYAHQAILASQSERFQMMFKGGMKQEKQNIFNIKDWTYTSFYSMIQFIYSSELFIGELTITVLTQLLYLSDYYLLEGLQIITQKGLIQFIDNETACELLIDSYKFNATELQKHTFEFVVKNISKIYEQPEYKQLEQYPVLLMELTKSVFDNANLKQL